MDESRSSHRLEGPSAAALDLQGSRLPRYIQLATLFRRRIESGQWPIGHQLPTVDELAEFELAKNPQENFPLRPGDIVMVP